MYCFVFCSLQTFAALNPVPHYKRIKSCSHRVCQILVFRIFVFCSLQTFAALNPVPHYKRIKSCSHRVCQILVFRILGFAISKCISDVKMALLSCFLPKMWGNIEKIHMGGNLYIRDMNRLKNM